MAVKTKSKAQPAKKNGAKKNAARKKPVKGKPAKNKLVKSKKPAAKPAKKAAPQKTKNTKPAARKAPARAARKGAVKGPAGFPEQVRALILKTLDDKQAENIATIDLRGQSPLYDYMIIASGRGSRQVKGLSDNLREALMKIGVKQVRIEGQQEANWVLVDAGDVIVHLFMPEVRQFYNLDKLYQSA